jgi:glycosyltransferase involved in cell wall biosynthesis
MKIALYSPYVPQHTGGGEKHFFDVARVLAKHHDVSIAVSHPKESAPLSPDLLKPYEAFVGQSLSGVTCVPTPLGTSASSSTKLRWTGQYDGLYVVSDGSFFPSLARRNHLHIQIPFTHALTPWQRVKVQQWTLNTNSEFTKTIIERHWRRPVKYVLEPFIDVPTEPVQNKQKIVLHVGRFFTHLHNKRHDVLLEAWQRWCQEHPHLANHWKLVMVGKIEQGSEAYVESLHHAAQGYPVEFVHDGSRQELHQLYQHASVYWHATGFEVSELEHPEQVEHFGISTLEAMSYGAIPLVVPKGGQPEILAELQAALSWNTVNELVEKTSIVIRAIEAHQPLSLVNVTQPVSDWREQLRQRSLWYNETRFEQTLTHMFPPE